MCELNVNEIRTVEGGILPVAVYIAGQYLTIYNMYKLAERVGTK